MSKLEIQIADILYDNHILYEREKTFEDLKGGRYRFDFYLPKMNVVIEVHGQ